MQALLQEPDYGMRRVILLDTLKLAEREQIAMILQVRLGTVQEHVENIVRKLGMENRHQMTVAVLRACSGSAGIG